MSRFMTAKNPLLRVIARAKRVIFMTTLYLQMNKTEKPSSACLEEINRWFKLVGDVNALKLPSMMRERIWKTRDSQIREADEWLAEGELEQACNKVIENTPNWLRYDTTPDFREQRADVIRVAQKVAEDKYYCTIGKP